MSNRSGTTYCSWCEQFYVTAEGHTCPNPKRAGFVLKVTTMPPTSAGYVENGNLISTASSSAPDVDSPETVATPNRVQERARHFHAPSACDSCKHVVCTDDCACTCDLRCDRCGEGSLKDDLLTKTTLGLLHGSCYHTLKYGSPTNKVRPILYLSGPMHGSKARPDDRDIMFEVAKLYSKQLWLYGYAVFTPHGNTTHMHGVPGLYSEPFLEFDLEFIRKMADCIFMMHGWDHADGCAKELEEARKKTIFTGEGMHPRGGKFKQGLPEFYTLQEAYEWIGAR